MSQGRRITVQEATITTATIAVKTLTLSNKQMTLAVFRQLIEEDIIDSEALELHGAPWGHVNYHNGLGCELLAEHLHIVWQKGDELRRAVVCNIYPVDEKMSQLQHTEAEAINRWLIRHAYEGWMPPKDDFDPHYGRPTTAHVDVPWGKRTVTLPESLATLWTQSFADLVSTEGSAESDAQRQVRQREALLQDPVTREVVEGFSLAELERTTIDAHQAVVQRRQRWQTLYAELAALPQLFIAV